MIIFLLICFENFAQKNPNWYNSDFILCKKDYFLKGNVKSATIKNNSNESKLFFDSSGFLTKRVNHNFQFNETDSMVIEYHFSGKKLKRYDLCFENQFIKKVFFDEFYRPVLSESPLNDSIVNIIKYCYDINNEMEQMNFTKFKNVEEISSRFVFDSSFKILEYYSWNKDKQLNFGQFRNQINMDSVYKLNPYARVEIYNYDTLDNIVTEKYYTNIPKADNYTKEINFQNGHIKSSKLIRKSGSYVEEKFDNFGKMVFRKNFNSRDSIIYIEENEYDSLGRLLNYKFTNVGFLKGEKQFIYRNTEYSIFEISDNYKRELNFDIHGNLLKASQKVLNNCDEATCCDTLEDKYLFNWNDCKKGLQDILVEYDSNDNWVSVKEFFDGKFLHETVRSIEYF